MLAEETRAISTVETITEAVARVDPEPEAPDHDAREDHAPGPRVDDVHPACDAGLVDISADATPAPGGAQPHPETPPASEATPARHGRAGRKRPRIAIDALARAGARAGQAIRKVAPGDEETTEHAATAPPASDQSSEAGQRGARDTTSGAAPADPQERPSAPETEPGSIGLAALLDQVVHADLDADDLGNRDPEFIAAATPVFDFLWNRYFRAEVKGAEHIPTGGPFIVVGNHSGGPLISDVLLKLSCWNRHFGPQRPPRALLHDGPLQVPALRNVLLKLGGVRSSAGNARAALAHGAPVLIYPAGDIAGPPRDTTPHTIDFLGRTAFIELAFEQGVPIVPIVNVGTDEASVASFASRILGRFSGVESFFKARNVSLPFGLPGGMWVFGLLPYLPLPSKIVYQVGKPIWCAGGPARAQDPAVVRRIYRRVTRVMQKMQDELASRR
jgi:1-acyl-sn-glycerol-3-phosphate acyltransferase